MATKVATSNTTMRTTNWVSTAILVYNCEIVIDVDANMVICNKMVHRDEFSPLNFRLLGWRLVEGAIWSWFLLGFSLRRLDRVQCHPCETTIPNCLNLWQLGFLIFIEKFFIVLLL